MNLRRRDPARDLDEVAATVERLAALVRAGATPVAAWRYVAAGSSGPTARLATRVADAAARGAPLAPAFAGPPGVAGWAWERVGALVALADEVGAPLAAALDRAAAGVRAVAALHRAVTVSVAGPAASARLTLLLPPGAALLGWAFGFDVPGVLVGTWAGGIALGLGVLLLLAARAWSRRLIADAEQVSWTVGLALELAAVAVRAGLPAERARDRAADARHTADHRDVDQVLAFAASAGVPVVALLEAEADRVHRAALAEAETRAAALAARLLLPLGLLVLPAFLLLGAFPIGVAVLSSTALPF